MVADLGQRVGLLGAQEGAFGGGRGCVHPAGRVLFDLAVAIADGAQRVSQLAAFGDQPDLAALRRAEIVVAERSTTFVPAHYFEALRESIDEPDDAPRLARAVRSARRRKRITPA